MGIDKQSRRDVVAVAGGTGLAPIKAMVDEMSRWNTARTVTLFFGVRKPDELYDIDALHRIAGLNPWLRVVPCVSDDPSFAGERGTLPEVLASYGDVGRPRRDRLRLAGHDPRDAGQAARPRRPRGPHHVRRRGRPAPDHRPGHRPAASRGPSGPGGRLLGADAVPRCAVARAVAPAAAPRVLARRASSTTFGRRDFASAGTEPCCRAAAPAKRGRTPAALQPEVGVVRRVREAAGGAVPEAGGVHLGLLQLAGVVPVHRLPAGELVEHPDARLA